MKKADLVQELVGRNTELTQAQASKLVNDVFELVGSALKKGESYSQDKFGTFKVVKRAARKGRNPQTGAVVDIAEKLAIKLVVSGYLKDELNV